MAEGEETRRDEARQEEKHEHAEIGEQDGAVTGEERSHAATAHATLLRAERSASELASTATSRITPETIGCQ